MAESPTLTFAIPYYAHRGYLAEAIDSVRAQTVADWELIVVDDRGPEPAGDLVAAYDDPRISYVVNDNNLGLAGNWNECLRRARTPWVTILHGDDRLRPEYAERVLAAIASAGPDTSVVFTDATIIDSAGQPTTTAVDTAKRLLQRGLDKADHDIAGDEGLAPLVGGNYIVCPTMCLRRDLVGEAPFDERWKFVTDWEFTVGELLAGRRLHHVRAELLEYRRHGAQQTALLTEDNRRFVEEFAFLDQAGSAAAELGWERSARAARRRVAVRGNLVMVAVVDLLRGRVAAARAKARLLVDDLRGRRRS